MTALFHICPFLSYATKSGYSVQEMLEHQEVAVFDIVKF